MKTLSTPLLALALLVPTLASAQAVWRCGPEGRSYSATPCADGRPVEVTADARPAEDIHAAQAQAARDIRTADTMRRERLAQEALQRGSGLGSLGPKAARVSAAKPDRVTSKPQAKRRQQLHPEAPGTWRAVAPVSRRTKD